MSEYLGKPFTSQMLWKCLMKFLPVVGFTAIDKSRQSADYEKMQRHLKRNFLNSNQTTYADIIKAVEGRDWKLAHRLAHTLKSNAGQIGEKRLQEIAAAAESPLKSQKPFPAEIGADLDAELKSVLEKLAPELAAAPKEETAAPSPEKTRELFEKLEDMLENRNPECMSLLDDVRTVPGAGELARLIENFEFKLAIDALAEIKNGQSGPNEGAGA
jgi:HPt (histidine-containing phosphotransfer) domain-containing protein